MAQYHLGVVADLPSGLTQANTQIHVFEVQEEAGVHAADREEGLTAYEQEGAHDPRDRRGRLWCHNPAMVVGPSTHHEVQRCWHGARRVLDGPAGQSQRGSDEAHAWIAKPLGEPLDARGVVNTDIRVEDRDEARVRA